MGPIWGRQDPGRLHVGPTNFAIWEALIPLSHDRSSCIFIGRAKYHIELLHWDEMKLSATKVLTVVR